MSELWAYVETLAAPGSVTLEPDEARHVVSRRLRTGDALKVFDARGSVAPARLSTLSKKVATVEIESIEEFERPQAGFQLATAIPKGERLSTMLQMWTQLGCEVWQPLICDDSSSRKLDIGSPRIQRILIESCKVARRPWAMEILPPLRLDRALETRRQEEALYFADREGSRDGFELGAGWVFVGPEAGFSEAEVSILEDAGARPVSLGDYNLRIETAGVAAMVAFNLTRRRSIDGSE